MAISSVRLLETADELEESEHVRTQLLRRVAHDIASPAGVTMTVLGELANVAHPRPDLIAMAQRSVRRLMRLSEQLAMVAELEAGALEPELASIDMRSLASQALEDALAIDGRKDITATCDLPPEPIQVTCDARLLAVVLREILSNALKLASSKVRISVAPCEGGAVLRVEDDGPGFSGEALATLGRRFVRRTQSRGLGLSLSMGLEIVRAHGGTLEITESSLPLGRRGTKGAAVTLTIPSATATSGG